MEAIWMDNGTILGILLGAVSSGFIALLVAFISNKRGHSDQKLAFNDMVNALQRESKDALDAVKNEIGELRDAMKEWTAAQMERKQKAQRKEFRREVELALSRHREECKAWRDSIVGDPSPFHRSTTARGLERLDSDLIDNE